MSKKWENAFFARVHYEEAMHEKYAEAMRVFENAHSKHSSTASDGAGGDWPDDDAIPSHVFHSLTPGEQQHYIIRRLSLGEKRIRYCPDFGSLSMMYQLNLGESMISEAERWLKEMNWMNEELEAQIASVRKEAYRIKYDYDLE